MSMWFWMNKAIKIGTNQGTLLGWNLNSCCLDHDDVTWDGSKGESFGKHEGGKKMRHGVLKRNRGARGTCSRKPHTLFWYNT